jgi:hypothetical protein
MSLNNKDQIFKEKLAATTPTMTKVRVAAQPFKGALNITNYALGCT